MIHIVNMHNTDGRMAPSYFWVDRKSPVGNPFKMHRESERDEVCNRYETYFNMLLRTPLAVHYLNKILRHLRVHGEVTLMCWCAPKRCHAETIKEWLEEMINE